MSVYSLELSGLRTRNLGHPCFHFSVVDSTQIVLKNLLRQNATEGTVVLADEQTQGRGRLGREWFSLPGSQIQASILLRPRIPVIRYPLLNLVAGWSIAETLSEYGVDSVGLKWPNDIYAQGRKIGGILSELESHEGTPALLLGFGINVEGKQTDFPESLREKAVTVEMLRKDPDRLQILTRFLNDFEQRLDDLVTTPEHFIGLLQERFAQLWIYRGKPLRIDLNGNLLEGSADGIDKEGALLLSTTDGKTHRVLSGDVHHISLDGV